THHTDQAALTLMSMHSVIEKDYSYVGPDLPMGKLVNAISRSHTNFLPVLDQDKTLLGIIDVAQLRHIIFRTELYQKFTVRQLMMEPAATLHEHEAMTDVMKQFDATDAQQLPVVDNDEKLIGYISRMRMYSMYRKIITDLSAE
ncbi:MAG: CBS domain-containing protein, partial [Prevotella sp.]|nr:CBS domain-containing protein [Prevotella sp.]